MERWRALEILRRCNASPNIDFHRLGSDAVERLLCEAKAHGYRHRKDANGSKARMFCQYLQRIAARNK
jgi:hypothetical protein